MNYLPGIFNYLVVVFLMMAGFYVVIAQGNLVKKLVGLGLFQASVFILYISVGKVADGMATVDAIRKVSTGNSGMHQDVPVEDVVIEKVTVQD